MVTYYRCKVYGCQRQPYKEDLCANHYPIKQNDKPLPTRCQGETNLNTDIHPTRRCRNIVKGAERYCHHHKNQENDCIRKLREVLL